MPVCLISGNETVRNSSDRTVDSLIRILESTNTDSIKIQAALNLAMKYTLSEPQKSLAYAESALNLAKVKKDTRLIALTSYHTALACFSMGLLEQAVTHFYTYYDYVEEINDTDAIAGTLINISSVRLQMKQFEKAEEALLTGLDFYSGKQTDKSDTIAIAGLATIYNNLGIVSKERGAYDKAEEYYYKGIEMASTLSSSHHLLANLFNNLGMAYTLSGQLQQAFDALNKALELRLQRNDQAGIAASFRNLGVYYEKVNDKKKAAENYYKAIQIAREIGSKTLLEGIYENVFELYQKIGNSDSALKYHILHKEQLDLINSEETTKVLTRMELTLHYEQQEKLRIAEQKRKEQRYFFISLLFTLVAVIALLLYILSQARLRRLRLEKANSELANKNLQLLKERLEAELEIKNKELATNVMYQIKKNEVVEEIVQKLLTHSPQFRKENQELIKSIIHDLEKTVDENVWGEFELRFQHVHNEFYTKLQEKNPDLSPNERRLCAFLKLNMTTKEIASITGQSQRSIEVARTRLRKKLQLTNSEQGLIEYLSSI